MTQQPIIDITSLQDTFKGTILVPGDNGYKAKSATYMSQGKPALIVQPESAEDVAAAVSYAASLQLLISVRSGGHSSVGFSTNDGGIVIDLCKLHDITVLEKTEHVVGIGGGATWGHIAKTLDAEGLALTSGDTTTVGVGGLTLGGGVGWMVRQYGLALDSLIAAEVVTADGNILQVDEGNHPDLFWAIRGGGGNFGIVTRFIFRAHPQGQVVFGNLTYKLENIASLLRTWRDCMRKAPEALNTTFLIVPSFGEGMPPTVQILCCYTTPDVDEAKELLAPLLQASQFASEQLAVMPYADILQDFHAPAGVQASVTNGFAHALSDELIKALAATYGDGTSSVLMIRYLGGAFSRIPAEATAFAHRDNEALIIVGAFAPGGTSRETINAALDASWSSVKSWVSGGYINFFAEPTPEKIIAAYPPPTYDKLAYIKQLYDPQNIFHLNYNITPQSKANS